MSTQPQRQIQRPFELPVLMGILKLYNFLWKKEQVRANSWKIMVFNFSIICRDNRVSVLFIQMKKLLISLWRQLGVVNKLRNEQFISILFSELNISLFCALNSYSWPRNMWTWNKEELSEFKIFFYIENNTSAAWLSISQIIFIHTF